MKIFQMFRKLLTACIVMKLVLNFVIIINGMHKSICLSFNFVVTIVANKAVFCDLENGLRLFSAQIGIRAQLFRGVAISLSSYRRGWVGAYARAYTTQRNSLFFF